MSAPVALEFEFRNQRFRDAERGLRAFARDFERNFQVVASNVLKKELRDYLTEVARALAARHGRPWPGGTGEQTLSRRSGRGIRSILEGVRVTGNNFRNIQGRISVGFPMRVHETGVTIRPRRAKYLAIPLPAALDGRGVPLRAGPRAWRHTFVQRSRKGNLLIFQKRGSQIVPLFLLKREVRVPARLGLEKTLRAGLGFFVDRVGDQILRRLQSGRTTP